MVSDSPWILDFSKASDIKGFWILIKNLTASSEIIKCTLDQNLPSFIGDKNDGKYTFLPFADGKTDDKKGTQRYPT